MNSQMKFLFAILLTALLGMGLAGCEAEGDGSSGGGGNDGGDCGGTGGLHGGGGD